MDEDGAQRFPEIVLVFPYFSRSDEINLDSGYNHLRAFLLQMAELRPEWIFLVAWPIRSPGNVFGYIRDGLFDHPRIIRVGWPYCSNAEQSCVGFYPQVLHSIDNNFGPTIYWSHCAEMSAALRGGYVNSWAHMSRPALVSHFHYTIHPTLPYPAITTQRRKILQLAGALASDANVYESKWALQMANEARHEFLRLDVESELAKKNHIVPASIWGDDDFEIPIRSYPVPVVLWNHRFEAYKCPQVWFAILSKLRSEGLSFEVWVTQAAGQWMSDWASIVNKIVGHPDRRQYLDAIAVPAVNISASVHETFCIAAVDSLILGHLGCWPNRATFPELLPADYPFLWNDNQEAETQMRFMLSHWDDVQREWSDRLRSFARRFHIREAAAQYVRIFEDCALLYHKEQKPHIEHTLRKTLEKLPAGKYRLPELTKRLRHVCRLGTQSMAPAKLVRVLGRYGARFEVDEQSTIVVWNGLRNMAVDDGKSAT